MTPGSFSPAEAARIAFLVARNPEAAPTELRQLFSIYLQALEGNPRHFAYQRGARAGFVASLQEIGAHVGEDRAREWLEAGLGHPVADPAAVLAALAVPPADRTAPVRDPSTVSLRGVVPAALRAEFERLARPYGVTLDWSATRAA